MQLWLVCVRPHILGFIEFCGLWFEKAIGYLVSWDNHVMLILLLHLVGKRGMRQVVHDD